ncbi:coiled-coil domain-containing protein 33 [Gadus chalcogrammus]|uniref:coiled-coil domain-containing protein 33 n=1 Tax=Gadus chalcogrammus TaxID=1042646 RepID=UPI0024C4815A|nr:coiled-coil domain-containing protein 33 [Gadus chalcogrammus]
MTSKPETRPASNHKTSKLLSSTFDLPSHNALAPILPEDRQPVSPGGSASQSPPAEGRGAMPSEGQPASPSQPGKTYQVLHAHKRLPLPDFKAEENTSERLTLQTKDVESYRSALDKMAEDMVGLRTLVVTLEAENSRLLCDLSLHQDLGQQLLDDADFDVMTKAEIADRIAYLKFKLASEMRKAGGHRDKVQQLQNEMIRRNDHEKEHVRLQKAYQEQQKEVQLCQSHVARVASLEATVKQQEKVIEKMEKVLDNRLTERNRKSEDKKHVGKKLTEVDAGRAEMEQALAAENAGIKRELELLNQQIYASRVQQSAQAPKVFPEEERLTLFHKLETSEARIRTLETQLAENCKLWGEEKQEMLTRLSETRHGLG